ncbi:MAG: PHP domain-containing protein [Candidatus Zhuqueibacterota bacterium]
MLRHFLADCHIHTCLSPCGDLDMSPQHIVKRSLELGLHIIAITDHNASENIAAVQEAADSTHLIVLAGMEVTSEEEAHLLALFDDPESMRQFQSRVYQALPCFGLDAGTLENQVIANARDEVEGFNDHLLLAATSLTFQQLVRDVHELNGLAIASHVDKESFSIIAQLGFIPPDVELDGLEISPFTSLEQARDQFPDANRYPLVKFSDAHYLENLGMQTTEFFIEHPTVAEIRMALRREQGRDYRVRESPLTA